MKNTLRLLGLGLLTTLLFSCSADEVSENNTEKMAVVYISSNYGLPTSLTLNYTMMGEEYKTGTPFIVETGDVIKMSGRTVVLYIDEVRILGTNGYAEYTVE